jgi:hypothetical protein
MNNEIKKASDKLRFLIFNGLIVVGLQLTLKEFLIYMVFLYCFEALLIFVKNRNYVEKIYESDFYKCQLRYNNRKRFKYIFNRFL